MPEPVTIEPRTAIAWSNLGYSIEQIRGFQGIGLVLDDSPELAEALAENERLRGVIALADEVIMDLHGSFPLDNGPLRDACFIIRSHTSNDYQTRKAMAEEARKIGEQS